MVKSQRDPAKEQFWRCLVGQWQQSGTTIRGFCARQRVSEANFHAWRRELARRDRERGAAKPSSGAGFVPVRVVPEPHAAVAPAAIIEIVLPRGWVVRVPAGADGAAVRTVLTALGATPGVSNGDHDACGFRTDAGAGEARSC